MYIMCVCLFSALSRRVGASQIFIIIIIKVEVAVLGLIVPNSPQCFCGRKATFSRENQSWPGSQ